MKKYKINYESVPHGVISWRHDGADAVYCEAGVEVRITWQPSAGWGLSEAHYIDAQGNEVAINTKEKAFTMPESDITIGGTFKRFVVTDWEGYEGGGGGGGTDYNNLDHKPSINGVTLQGNKTGKELKLDDVKYVSTFDGVTGDPDKLYFLDTKYDTYKVGFYRFIPASDENPARFERTNPSVVKYVSTFAGVTGDTESLYYLDTEYSTYKVGFYRYVDVEEAGAIVGRFVPIGSLVLVEEVTYAELKALRDNSMLIPGMQYRITDYVATTVQENTLSANHPFDIIVKADSANTLNEDACAALHEGDTYFANNDLSAWKLKYCLDNDTSRFAWADAANGKGVVYNMVDEFGNECPYDFKNVQFKRFKVTDGAMPAARKHHKNKFVAAVIPETVSYSYPETIIVKEDSIFAYTFSSSADGGEQTDFSLSAINNVHHNVFKPVGTELPDNVCYGDTVYGNNFGIAERNTFRRGSYCNNFDRCRYNVFGERLFANTIANAIANVSRELLCNSLAGGNFVGNDFWRDTTINVGDGFYYNTSKAFFNKVNAGCDVKNNIFERDFYHGFICSNVHHCKFGRMYYSFIGSGVTYMQTNTTNTRMSNKFVLPMTSGTEQEPLFVEFSIDNTVQFACKRTDGTLRIWNPADDTEQYIIDVTELPTTDIDTQALYRLTATHYYHNDIELADAPQGYKSLNEGALVADENGLTVTESGTSTTTPWAEVTDAMIATLVSGSLVATCEFGEAGFFKTDADEYDYAANFSTADTYTLWHNATGEPTDWVEVDSVSNLVTDGETTEDVDGELRANAIVDVTALPTTGIKAKTLYRMRVDRYFEDGTVLPDTPSGYLSIRPAIVIIDETGITDNGTHYAWADITDDKMDFWIIRRQISQVYAADLMTMSTCFRTAENHYVYKDNVTKGQVYELYHNPTATANAFIKIGGEGGSAEVDDVTTEEVNGKVQANAVIEVNSLPTTDIKTKSLYRRMETVYKHDGVEVPNVTIYKVILNDTIEATPEGIRYKPSGPVVAWDAANIGAVIQQAITDGHVETTTWDEAEFFAFGDGEYDYENHFSRILPGSLWQNQTGAAAGWEEVGGEQAIDEVSIVEEHGILQALAVIDVTQLPSAGMKGNSLYRKVETVMVPGLHIYTTYYHGGNDPVPEPVECYKPARAGVEFRTNEIYIDGVEHSYEELRVYKADWVAAGYIVACDFLDIDTTTFDGAVGYPNEGSYQFLNRERYTYNTDPVPVVMNKIFQYTPGGAWESISTVQISNAAYNQLDYDQKMDGTTYIVEG